MNKFLDKLSSKILFEAKLQHIQNKNIRIYLYSFLNLKTILFKLATLFIFCFVCAILYFVLRQWSLNNFLSIKVIFNSGAAFNFGEDWNQSVVYLFKIIPTIVFFFVFIFSNKWLFFIPSCLIFVNSLFIIIDKSLTDIVINADKTITSYSHTVVDYLDFKIFVNNIGDIFICIGVVLLAISIVYAAISEWKRESKEYGKEVRDTQN